jgi:hypothetical protein
MIRRLLLKTREDTGRRRNRASQPTRNRLLGTSLPRVPPNASRRLGATGKRERAPRDKYAERSSISDKCDRE